MVDFPLCSESLSELRGLGYTVLPEYLSPDWRTRLQERLLHFAARFPGRKALLPDAEFLQFFISDELLAIPRAVLGPTFLFHHANGRALRGSGTSSSKPWHHDHDGPAISRARRKRMYHVMVYPAGLPQDVAPLVLKPRSHLLAVDRKAPVSLGVAIDPEDMILGGAPGLVVVIDSALWHMRPGASTESSRFDINVSFCEPAGSWPERTEWCDVHQEIARQLASEHSAMFRHS